MMNIKERLQLPKGKVSALIHDAKTGELIDKMNLSNVVVEDAKSILLRGIGGYTSTDYQINTVKLGSDFVNAWTGGTGTLTTDPSDPTKRLISGTGTSFTTELTPSQTEIDYMNDGKLWIRISSTGERRKVLGITSNTELYVDLKFDTDLSGDSFEFEVGYSPSSPESPESTFDENSMDVVYSDQPSMNVSHDDTGAQPKVDFQFTLVGSDVIAAQTGSPNHLNFSSAALHTGDGTTFSYIRFPKFSISNLINVSVIWTIYYE